MTIWWDCEVAEGNIPFTVFFLFFRDVLFSGFIWRVWKWKHNVRNALLQFWVLFTVSYILSIWFSCVLKARLWSNRAKQRGMLWSWRLRRRFHWTGWKFHLRLGVFCITSCNTKLVEIGISSLRWLHSDMNWRSMYYIGWARLEFQPRPA